VIGLLPDKQTASHNRTGWSGQPSAANRLEPHGLPALTDGAAFPKPHIVAAHSYGALVAIAYAVRHSSAIACRLLVAQQQARGNPSESLLKTLGAWHPAQASLAGLDGVRLALSLLVAAESPAQGSTVPWRWARGSAVERCGQVAVSQKPKK
jgi:pimeloyl-ACP methyl ester carboxylesterase